MSETRGGGELEEGEVSGTRGGGEREEGEVSGTRGEVRGGGE